MKSALHQSVLCGLFALAFYATAISAAHASAMVDVLCIIYFVITDDIGRGLASLAIIMLGFAAMTGKASWGMGVTVSVGICIIFQSAGLAAYFGIPNPC